MKILTIFLWKSGPLYPNHINLAALGESLGQRLLEPTTATPSGAATFVESVVEGSTSSPCGFSGGNFAWTI